MVRGNGVGVKEEDETTMGLVCIYKCWYGSQLEPKTLFR